MALCTLLVEIQITDAANVAGGDRKASKIIFG